MGGQSSGRDFLHPLVSFEPFSSQETLLGVPKGSPKKIKVVLKPETSASPVELRLKTRTGTGLAQFDPSNLNFDPAHPSALPISGFNLGTGDVVIKGITESSTADNIRLEAHPRLTMLADPALSLGKLDFSVVSVQMELRARTGLQISRDNSGICLHTFFVGHSNLGPVIGGPFPAGCLISMEAVGLVTPTDYDGKISLRRRVISDAVYQGSTLMNPPNLPASDPSVPCEQTDGRPCNDSSPDERRDDDPQSGSSVGKVYDLDSPGLFPLSQNVTVVFASILLHTPHSTTFPCRMN
jgi:hypothetical protein